MVGQDTLMKALTRSLSKDALSAFGIQGVELTEPVPTELPASTLRMDKVWRMQDGQLFHLEFQSKREPTLHRFLEYDARLAHLYQARIRTVVLYHANVMAAPSQLDIGVAVYRVENVFLSRLNGDEALNAVEKHLLTGIWEPEDRLRLALAMNMQVRDHHQAFDRVLALAAMVSDDIERDLVVSAMLTFADQALDETQRLRLRRELRRVSKLVEELFQEGREEGREEMAIQVAKKLFARGASVDEVADITGLPPTKLEEIQRLLH
ncbi:hypothetical protein GCM10010885_14940 [Alicyclobacillus cellulosilyticus]|uniref:Uncharacterized protein n=1 Tax=Alicyclobacillus cellulosilyticus TaxID=1003997 RepID=A0A917NK47_9BACL|nr:hypothetical protein [Alicyclobacillus cellulosilyticus]GGJ06834.1 hypothetical protein GCM10010885_14940 [Alicyclobacillus cellulosilyticus]